MKSRTVIAATILTLSLPSLAVTTATAAGAKAAIASCSVGHLRATAELDGAMGSREGSIVLTNHGAHACTLKGRAGIGLRDAAGHPIFVQIHTNPKLPDNGHGRAAQQRRAGIVQPGQRAFIGIRWINWCGRSVKLPMRAVVQLPNRSQSLTAVFKPLSPHEPPLGPPPCSGASEPSVLDVRPIQVRANSAPAP